MERPSPPKSKEHIGRFLGEARRKELGQEDPLRQLWKAQHQDPPAQVTAVSCPPFQQGCGGSRCWCPTSPTTTSPQDLGRRAFFAEP